jgi:Tfp pilus assembly protein PilO
VKQKNMIVGALAALLVLALWYMMLYSPLTSAASKANQATTAAKTTAKSLEQQIAGLKGDLPSQKGQKQQLNLAIPSTPAESAFLRDLDRVKAASGVTFQSVAPSPPTGGAAGATTSINVSISVSGSVAQVHKYLTALATLKRLFVIDNVSLTAGASTNGSNASSSGGPVGDVFAGPGAPPTLQAQIAGRIFTQATIASATPGVATAPAAASAPASASH